MSGSLSAATLSLGLLLSATPGYCYSVTSLGVFTGTTNANTQSLNQDDEASPIEDYYSFSVTKNFNIAASVTNAFSATDHYIDGFTIEGFKGLPPAEATFVALASGSPVASGTNSVPSDLPDRQTAKLKASSQLAGYYYLKVTGSAEALPSYGGSLAVTVSTVPLPASAPMFGAALLALGAVGYGLKRKKASAAA